MFARRFPEPSRAESHDETSQAEVGGFVGWVLRSRKRSPPAAVHDLVEGASVQPFDHSQRLVGRITDGE